MNVIYTNTPDGTQHVGRVLSRSLEPGDVVDLQGELGAGKTLLVKGIASGLGINETVVTSPTFAFINEYDGPIPLYHFDVYRLNRADEVEDLGYEEYFYGKGISLVEWGNRITDYMPTERLVINIHKLSESKRRIELQPLGARYLPIAEGVVKEVSSWSY